MMGYFGGGFEAAVLVCVVVALDLGRLIALVLGVVVALDLGRGVGCVEAMWVKR
jgi:hypothetical protein